MPAMTKDIDMTQNPNAQTQAWQQLDAAHHLHPFTDNGALNAKGSRVISHADGVYIHTPEGDAILDGMAGLWCVNMGYGRTELVQAATEQLNTLPYYNLFFQCTHPPATELAAQLTSLLPDHLNRVFFTGSGSECNDTVVRMVRHYWASQGQPKRKAIISRHNAYHGSTMAGASLGGMKPMHAQGGLPIPDIHHIDQPYHFGEGQGMDANEFGLERARQLEAKILELGPENVAAFIGEPVQGAGGVIIPPETYWPEIQRICRQYDILLISDEVICGFGRLGHWLGCEHFGVKPDLVCMAKGITSGYVPLGAVAVGDRVAQGLLQEGGEFNHGFTYSGHPVACAVASANLKLMADEKVLERINAHTAPYLQRRWAELADHPLVGEARGLGMVAALELVADKASGKRFDENVGAGTVCRDFCIESGLVMRAVGDTMIISPPLIITEAEIDELIARARRSLDLTWQKLVG
ncbi:aspartate aminotransferase family protein [Ferrimonas balearica]|uniref:aspartate aminotransferase family protein n=1 Tax=Ferrimonas balearica TaxID=44012 RepID=UPI001FED59A1|nr:aspartate aminotransferase family protein [Ferrimonas balearica]MBW3138259.1 aspartate aminotransferase family protein [Ferrimonas balearica]MBW3164189.1 aspartate aminotransferase family protein [Ferrimonas balearica]MBY6105320.1 aspartate aminotransferase family protein [Ferrimonas balearica]MBY6225166.1 aspartate aminotransferase family protein [Ferrimonas balearica]